MGLTVNERSPVAATHGSDGAGAVNVRTALFVTMLGVIAIGGGLWLGRFDRQAFSGLLLEIGAAIGLVAVLVVVEERLVRRASTAAAASAREVVREESRNLADRVLRLEELDEAHAARRDEQRERDQEAVNRIRVGGLDVGSVAKLLVQAENEGLIASGWGFRIRTGERTDSSPLYPMVFAPSLEHVVFLAFEALTVARVPALYGVPDQHNIPEKAPDQRKVVVEWKAQSADEIAFELELALRRANQPAEAFSFRYALEQVAQSVEVMRSARSAPLGDPRRLRGRLVALVNAEWAWTDWGLESVDSEIGWPMEICYTTPTSTGTRQGFLVAEPDHPCLRSPAWADAADWIRLHAPAPIVIRGVGDVAAD